MTLVLGWRQPEKFFTLAWRGREPQRVHGAALEGPPALSAILAPPGPKGDKGDQGEIGTIDNSPIDGGFF